MDLKLELKNKEEDLKEVQEIINKGPKKNFLGFFLKCLGLGFVGFLISSLLEVSFGYRISTFIFVFALSMFIEANRIKRVNKEKSKDLIGKRLSLQKEIVALRKEIRNEDN